MPERLSKRELDEAESMESAETGISRQMPDIHFNCSHCGQDLIVEAAGAGLSVECPECRASLVVPEQRVPPVISDASFHLRQISDVEREELHRKRNAEQIVAVESAAQTCSETEHLTPKQFSDFIGQNRVKARLELAIMAAKQRVEALPHVLLVGPPGLGKATLASIIPKAMGAGIKSTSGSLITKAGELAGILTNLEEGDVLFIDEIHRLQKNIEDYFYLATKDFKLDIIIDQGSNARSIRLNLPRFTLIGTTPRPERVSRNLLSLFPIVETLEAYSNEDLAAIAHRFVNALKLEIDQAAVPCIAHSSDRTPIDVLNRLQHVRDFAQVKGEGRITLEVAEAALKMLAFHDEKQEASENRDTIPSEVRREVWRRDGGKCGSRERLEFDHIIPVAKGGSNTARNIELLCESCNRSKSASIQ
ncbi:MAG: AAA family ATPase [Verrucomicrobiota bacterium]|jgi:Holliday junction DNA helicase RuvB